MGQKIRYFGLAVVAASLWLMIAGEADWIGARLSDTWSLPLAKIGAACFALGLLASVWNPLARRLAAGRCVRCGARTERGHAYCIDHLRTAVQEAQDHIRDLGERHPRRS